MNKKLLFKIIGVIAILGIAYSIWYFRGSLNLKRRLTPTQRDIEFIEDKKANPVMRMGALMRLANNSEPLSREYSLKILKDQNNNPKPLVIGAIRVIGLFTDDASHQLLFSLIASPDQATHSTAIEALGKRENPKRVDFLKQFLKSTGITERDKIIAYPALYRTSTIQEDKNFAIDQLLSYAKSTADSTLQIQATFRVVELDPKNEKLIQLLKSSLENPKTPISISIQAIRTLGAQTPPLPWLKKNFKKIMARPDREIRIAALNVIQMVCPDDRYKIFSDEIKYEKDNSVNGTLFQALLKFPTPAAIKIVSDHLASLKPADPIYQKYKTLEQQLKTANKVDPCVLPRTDGVRK